MLPLYKSEVKSYHTRFQKERKKAFEGLAYLTSIANDIADEAFSCTDEFELTSKLKMIKRFSNIFEEFNHDVELAMSRFDKRMVDIGNESIEQNYALLQTPSCIVKADLTVYKAGDRGKCAISYIKSVDEDLCYVVDLGRPHDADFTKHILSPFDGLPDIGVIFAVLIENKHFRAIRTHSESTLIAYQVTLIDIGETIALPLYCSEKFLLTPEAVAMPPIAVLCLICKVDGVPSNCLRRVLGTKRFNFQIVNICVNLLEIELFTLVEDEHSQRMSQVNVLTENMNKPIVPAPATRARLLSMSTTVNESTASKAAPVAQSDIPETNPFRIEQMRQNRSLSIVSSASTACLLEEPSSSNANNINQIQKSVVDSQTKKMNIFDDVPVVPCPSKAESDSCHTGAHPKNVQQVNESPSSAVMTVGQELSVTTMVIVNSTEIYVQITSSAQQLYEFQNRLNSETTMRKLSRTPDVGEYVLARFGLDGLLYRACVTQVIDQNQFEVFYLDYGNSERVNLDNAYEWHSVCNTLPFQAIKCTLANIQVHEGCERDVTNYLHRTLVNRPMAATVLSKGTNGFVVRLKDTKGYDIAEHLYASGLTAKSI